MSPGCIPGSVDSARPEVKAGPPRVVRDRARGSARDRADARLAAMSFDLLLPRPLQRLDDPGPWLRAPLARPADAESGPARTAFDALARLLDDPRGEAASPAAPIDVVRVDAFAPEEYELSAGRHDVRVRHRDEAGLAHALRTFAQWLALHRDESAAGDASPGRFAPGRAVPGIAVRDRPALAERGVMLDVSRDRVPRTDELERLVDLLASWKLNRLQLYNEAAFAHPAFEPAWRGRDPFTADEIRALDRYCADRGIELVPNQQSFGHLHHYLVHEPWRAIAECPDGVEHPFSRDREPFSLCPTDPRALEFLDELYDGFLPLFTSRTVNAGMDETFDLGLGRSAAACAERGKHTVYLEFLRAVRDRLHARGRRMQFWADIVLAEPDRVREVPDDAIAMAWGYEATHPFERELPVLAASGLDFVVCPGTSSWNSIGGRCENARVNITRAAAGAADHGARGLLVTDWGDRGHHQPPVVSSFGFAIAAGSAWNPADVRDGAGWARVVDRHVFDGTGELGDALLALGRVDDANACAVENGSSLFFALYFARDEWPNERVATLDADGAAASRDAARAVVDRLTRRRSTGGASDDHAAELEWCARALEWCADFAAARIDAPRGPLHELAGAGALGARLRALGDEHERHWSRRSRPGGLARSRAVLEDAARALQTGEAGAR